MAWKHNCTYFQTTHFKKLQAPAFNDYKCLDFDDAFYFADYNAATAAAFNFDKASSAIESDAADILENICD